MIRSYVCLISPIPIFYSWSVSCNSIKRNCSSRTLSWASVDSMPDSVGCCSEPWGPRPAIGWNLKKSDQFQFRHLVRAGTSMSVHVLLPHTRTTKEGRKVIVVTISISQTRSLYPPKRFLMQRTRQDWPKKAVIEESSKYYQEILNALNCYAWQSSIDERVRKTQKDFCADFNLASLKVIFSFFSITTLYCIFQKRKSSDGWMSPGWAIYLKLTNLKDNIPIPKDIDIENNNVRRWGK